MAQQPNEKKYNGIIPKDGTELRLARRQLAEYMRTIWHDEIFAMEIELEVSKENYEERMKMGVAMKIAINYEEAQNE